MTWLRANLMTTATLVLVVLLGLQTWRLYTAQIAHQALIASHAAQIADQQRQLAEATARARNTEQHLVTQAATMEASKNAEIHRARTAADALRRRLRDAAALDVPAAAPATCLTGAVSGGDRAELSGSPQFDLVSEAERADQLRAALAACTGQYNAARAALMQH